MRTRNENLGSNAGEKFIYISRICVSMHRMGKRDILSYNVPRRGSFWVPDSQSAIEKGFTPAVIIFSNLTVTIAYSPSEKGFIVGSTDTFIKNYRQEGMRQELVSMVMRSRSLARELNDYLWRIGELPMKVRRKTTVVVGNE